MNFAGFFNQFGYIAIVAFALTVLLVFAALKIFPKIGFMDRPLKYGLKRAPIPYYGGVAIFIAFIVSVLLFVPLTKALIGLLIGGSFIAFIGFFDDMFDLKPWIRMIFQFLGCITLIICGIGILSINIPLIGVLDFSGIVINGVVVLSAIFTIIWVIAVVNTMNLLDGISGLTSGVSFIACTTIFILSIHPGVHENPESQIGVATIALILAVISLAFFIFDFTPAKILMGDTGSTFLGFVIATLAIFSGGKVATAFLVLGIPILDMVWVVLRRTFSGKKFWKGDTQHLHHRLLDVGISDRKAVILYLTITAILGGTSVLFVSGQQKIFILIGLVILMILLAGSFLFLKRRS